VISFGDFPIKVDESLDATTSVREPVIRLASSSRAVASRISVSLSLLAVLLNKVL